MNLDTYIKLAEKMIIAAEKYIKATDEFQKYKDNLTVDEFELMIANAKNSKEMSNKIEDLEERLCKAERQIKFY